jgi:hypothetical protein
MSSTKYGNDNLNYHRGSLTIRGGELYKHMVESDTLALMDEQESTLIECLKDGDDQDGALDNNERALNEHLDGQTFPDGKASIVLDNSRNVEDDQGLWEGQDPDEARTSQASHTYTNDVNEEFKDIYERLKDRYDELNDDIDTELATIHSDPGYANPNDIIHVVAVNALAFNEDFEGTFADKVRQISELDMAKAFTSKMAFKEIIEGDRAALYPDPVQPGSIMEAAAILDYLDASEQSSRGGYGVGGAYIDSRSDGNEREYAFVEYTDNAATAVLGVFVEPITQERLFEVRAIESLKYALADVKQEPDAASVAVIARVEGDKPAHVPAAQMKAVLAQMTGLVAGDLGRKPTVGDYENLASARNMRGMDKSELKQYLALVHPEVARVQAVSERYSKREMDALLTGVMDGSPKAKERVAALKTHVDELVAPATPALQAFRKGVESKLNPADPGMDAPSL